MAIMTIDQAQRRILDDARLTPVVELPLAQLLGRVLREDVIARYDVPPCKNSAMDGYVLCVDDLGSAPTLPVVDRIVAGDPVKTLPAGGVARIFTGAPIPKGANAVVMQEEVDVDGDRVRISGSVKLGDHIRPQGQDLRSGETVFEAGRRLDAVDIGLLAAAGYSSAKVATPPRVALLSTGDELVDPGEPLAHAGQIYNSNRPMLAAMLTTLGCDVTDGGIVRDDAAATGRALLNAAQADLVISTGGVSVGEEDYVKSQVEALGELQLWKLAIKPGKPVAYGRIQEAAFFGLPGNPASSFVTFALIVRPYLLAMQGASNRQAKLWKMRAGFDWLKEGTRQEYLRAQLVQDEAGMRVDIYPNQSSGVLKSVSWANALAVIPPGVTLKQGDPVDVLLMSELLA